MLFTAGVFLESVLESFALVGRRVAMDGGFPVSSIKGVHMYFCSSGVWHGLLVWTRASGGRDLRDEATHRDSMTLCT